METIINELTIDDTSEICKEEEADTESQADNEADVDNVEDHRSVSAIMQELQNDLERPIMEVMKFLFSFVLRQNNSIDFSLRPELETVARLGESRQRCTCNHEARRLDIVKSCEITGRFIGHDGE